MHDHQERPIISLGRSRADRTVIVVLWVQGVYYLVTGVWPLVSIQTFQMVTGMKTDHLPTGREADHWLVMTVGVLIMVIGTVLLIAAWRGGCPVEIMVLAMGSALGLTAIDIIYVYRQVILPIYLLDSMAEIILLAIWVTALYRQSQRFSLPRPLPIGDSAARAEVKGEGMKLFSPM